jgi:dUTP pyrophosphatase
VRIYPIDSELYSHERSVGFGPAKPGDAGVDLRARTDTRVHVGRTVAIPLGVAIAVPEDAVGWITGRSSTQLKMGLFVHEGKIDSGYRGEVHCLCSASENIVEVHRGDRLCSLVVLKIIPPVNLGVNVGPGWQTVESLEETDRGAACFGSTGLR